MCDFIPWLHVDDSCVDCIYSGCEQVIYWLRIDDWVNSNVLFPIEPCNYNKDKEAPEFNKVILYSEYEELEAKLRFATETLEKLQEIYLFGKGHICHEALAKLRGVSDER